MKVRGGDRVVVSDRFPPTKRQINKLEVGDVGTVKSVYRHSLSEGIAIVDWDKGFRTTANESDLDPEDKS